MTHVPQIQVKLDENNNKRQNVQFLKNLLDQQLNALVSNLTAIQNNNSAIELETIQRLQLVEKFGEDASEGLNVANQQSEALHVDLNSQAERHRDATELQEEQQQVMVSKLTSLEGELEQLKARLNTSQANHARATLEKHEQLSQELNQLGNVNTPRVNRQTKDTRKELDTITANK